MSSLMQLKAQNESRLAEEKRLIDRKRNVLILALQYCVENGYVQTAEKLQQEAGVAISKFEVVENIDLLRIVQEYEEYHEMKFGKRPKLVRRLSPEEADKSKSSHDKKSAAERRKQRNDYSSPHMPTEARVENNAALKAISHAAIANGGTMHAPSEKATKSSKPVSPPSQEDESLDLGLIGQKPAQRKEKIITNKKPPVASSSDEPEESVEERLLKPLPSFLFDSEMRPLAEMITREIFQKNPNVRWEDVIGLHETKRLLKEAVVMPLKYPQLFQARTEGYSGADIKLVAKEACMAPVRRLMTKLETVDTRQPHNNQLAETEEDWRTLMGHLTQDDLITALDKTKPSALQMLKKYQQWQLKFGST
ncbi:hypothetical protein ATCC90586_005600 [Pythium insidiosum]|nr:hypothetical protein ATCC90586_005600 [Pythium insidiosum]